MSKIDFSKIDTFASVTAFNIDKDGVVARCSDAKASLEMLDKMLAVKTAMENSSPEDSILNIRKIKDIDSILEISTEDLDGKELVKQLDVYRTNVMEKMDMCRNSIADIQGEALTYVTEAIMTYRDVLNQFEEEMVGKQVTPERFSNAVSEDSILNFKIMTSEDYISRVFPFRNRFGYFVSFINPKGYTSNFNSKDFATGAPFFKADIYDEENELLFVEPAKLKSKTKLSLAGWNASNISSAYNKFVRNDAKLCDAVEGICDKIRKFMLTRGGTATIQMTPIYTSMVNAVNGYIYAQEALMSMIYNLLSK